MNRQNLKLTLLFAGLPLAACLATVTVLGAANSLSGDTAAPRPPATPAANAASRLDPDLHDAVLQALNPVTVSVPPWLLNPFVDRAGLSSKDGRGGTSQTTPKQPAQPAAPPAQNGPKDAAGQPLATFETRYRQWQEKLRAVAAARRQNPNSSPDAPPVTSVYSITELDAVGEGSQGSVWLQCKPINSGFTAAPGTRFLDATFVGIRNKEAVFETAGGKIITLPLMK